MGVSNKNAQNNVQPKGNKKDLKKPLQVLHISKKDDKEKSQEIHMPHLVHLATSKLQLVHSQMDQALYFSMQLLQNYLQVLMHFHKHLMVLVISMHKDLMLMEMLQEVRML